MAPPQNRACSSPAQPTPLAGHSNQRVIEPRPKYKVMRSLPKTKSLITVLPFHSTEPPHNHHRRDPKPTPRFLTAPRPYGRLLLLRICTKASSPWAEPPARTPSKRRRAHHHPAGHVRRRSARSHTPIFGPVEQKLCG